MPAVVPDPSTLFLAATEGSSSLNLHEHMSILNMASRQKNALKVNYVHNFSSIIAGCVAGIAGLQGLYGFLFFVAFILVIQFLLLMKMKFNVVHVLGTTINQKSTTSANLSFLFSLETIMNNLMSYLLFWTLLFGVVHIYGL